MIYILISGNASLPGGTRPHLGAMYPHLGAMRPHLGATRPRVGIVKLGLDAPTWQYNDKSGACFVFACQGIEPCQANADAGTRRPQVRLRPPPGETAPSPRLFSL